jgi:uncharacterized delta-60 repeat protein
MRFLIQAPIGAFTSPASLAHRAKRAAFSLCLFAVLLIGGGATSARGQSAIDGFEPNANDGVRVVVVQPDGKILLGGAFTTLAPNGAAPVTRNHIARLNADGTLDTAFNPNANGPLYAIAVQPDGKILLGGLFTTLSPNGGGAVTRNRIARLNPDGTLDTAFDPNADGIVESIAVQSNGQILAGGFFTTIGGETRNFIARLDATTGLADSFNPNASAIVSEITLQADGKILVGGSFTSIGGQPRNHIARLDAGSGLADSFDPDASHAVVSIAIQANGKILAAGQFMRVGGEFRNRIARLDPTSGSPDSFNPIADNVVNSIVVQADGMILVGGSFTTIGPSDRPDGNFGQVRNYIARIDPATGLPDSFNPSADDPVYSIAVQADGKILAGGLFTTFAPNGGPFVTRNRIARLEADGRLDRTLVDPNIVGGAVLATAVQPDGKILLGGNFTDVLGVTRNNIARLNMDGTLDTAFNPNANGDVHAIAVQVDGKILVGGNFFGANSIGGQGRNFIARLDATTGVADSFNPNADNIVGALAVQADGQILAGGVFTSIGGQTRTAIARLDPTTGLADSFDPRANKSGFINSIVVQANGKILVGGNFSTLAPNGGAAVARNSIARLNSDGTLDPFDPNSNDIINAIAVQADGKVLACGQFTNIGGQDRNFMARLDALTGLADSFNPSANSFLFAIAVQADGKILASGGFSGANSIGGEDRNFIARLNTDGTADSFDPNPDDEVRSITFQADGKILAGGLFANIGGQTRNLFARLSNDTAALQDLTVTQTTVAWTRGGSSSQFTRVTFEHSTDNANYTALGNGTAAGSNWILTGLSLVTGENFYVRARGYYQSGYHNGSASITESVRNAFIPGPAGTPTPTPPGTPTPSPSPTATPTPTLTPNPTPSSTPAPTPSPTPAAQALNLSTRMRVQTGDNAGIGGFIITGTAPKQVLLRGIGPSLAGFGIADALANPTLDLRRPDGTRIRANDNWRDDPVQAAAIKATGIPPQNDLEAAIIETLDPGSYTVILRGMGMTTGVGLVEVYDLNQGANSKLANLSTRAFVEIGNNIVIAGFVLGGSNGNDRVVARGIGPSLTAFGVANALADPTLELRDSNGALLASNNDWQDNAAQAAELTAAALAPTNNSESGIAITLPPGPYTALLAGLNNGTGVGVVEVYDRGAP